MVHLSGHDLTLDQIVAVARYGEPVAPLGEPVKQVMGRSREWVRRAVERADKPIYGVNTGFGPLASEGVKAEQAGVLSRNLVLNCCAGTGPALSPEIVRSMMLIRVNTLARGNSGVRPEVADTYIRMLNEGVVPFVPSLGSLGASGDLAPLAAIAAVMTRDHGDGDGGYSGQAWHGGELMSGAEAMAAAGIPRFAPLAKEGLALTNGTTFMVSAGVLGSRARREPPAARGDRGGPHVRESSCSVHAAPPGPQRGQPAVRSGGDRRTAPCTARRESAHRLGARPRPGCVQPALHAPGARSDQRRHRVRAFTLREPGERHDG